MSKHSILSPSSANRWLKCPASIKTDGAVFQAENEAANVGTYRHSLCETAARQMIWLGKVNLKGMEIEAGGIKRKPTQYEIDIATRWAEYITNESYHSVEIEKRVNFTLKDPITGKTETFFGTADAIVKTMDGTLRIIDFKSGQWYVSQHSPQLKLYAIGAIQTLDKELLKDVKIVSLEIYQPETQPAFRASLLQLEEL